MMEKSDIEKVFNKMLEINDRPVLVDCVVDPDDMVFPMVLLVEAMIKSL